MCQFRFFGVFLLTLAMLVGLGLWTSADAVGGKKKGKDERLPHVHHAIKALEAAKREIKEADHDFGGHRQKTIEAVDHAIKQLHVCLKHDKK